MKRTLLLVLLLSLNAFAIEAPQEVDTDARVVVFADVHGAYPELVELLQEVRVIDADTNWIGGNTHLVSLGDLIDRGAESRKVLQLLIKLETQAAAAGGALHLVLGNHEVMVMSGDLRYVSREEYGAFAGDETGAEREALLDSLRMSEPNISEEELRLKFERYYPPGFLGLQRAFASDGEIGRWLLQKPLVLRVNDKLYMHGGISNAIAELSIGEINDYKSDLVEYVSLVESLRGAGVLDRHVDFWGRRAHLNGKAEAVLAADPQARPAWFAEFARLAELESALVFTTDSPIWYRGSAYCHPYAESFNTERLLKRTGTRQLVVGHTPDPRGALQRLDGQVLRLDTGMLKAVYRGRATALVQEQGKQYLHYAGQAEPAQPIVDERSMSRELWGMSDAELESLLRTGEIINSREIGTGVTKPLRLTVRLDDKQTDAVYKHEDSLPGLESRGRYIARKADDADRYQYDPAAYRLDRLLDLQMVPVSVIRKVEDREGSVGAWIPNAINERDRVEQQVPFDGYCEQTEQYRLRFVFDILIHNDDRNLTNIIWTRDDFMLRFIDHSLAFRSPARRPKQYRKVTLRVSDLLRGHLEQLNKDNLTRELSAWLHPRQIETILERRDLILEEAVGTDP